MLYGDDSRCFELMNKDKVVAVLSPKDGESAPMGALPHGYAGMPLWLSRRRRWSCVSRPEEFYLQAGINWMSDYIREVHMVSMNDTFWVRLECENVSWEDVSPFRHPYSKEVTVFSLDHVHKSYKQGYYSPDMARNGSYPACWDYNGGDVRLLKAAYVSGYRASHDPYSEYFASELCDFLGFEHVSYDLVRHERVDGHVSVITSCRCYTSEKVGSVPAYELGLTGYEQILSFCQSLGGHNAETFLDMLFLDCLLMNPDRHLRNVEFFVDNDTQEVLSIVPIFDNNKSMLPYCNTWDHMSEYARGVAAADGRPFENLYYLVRGYKDYTDKLKLLRDFQFEMPSVMKGRVGLSDLMFFLNNFVYWRAGYLLRQ